MQADPDGLPFGPIADFIHGLRFDDLPAEVVHMSRRCLVDLVGIWAAGSLTEAGGIACNHAALRYSGGPKTLPLLFDGRAVNPIGFAFAGAASIDAVDGHDGHERAKGHAGVAVLPALIAELGEAPAATLESLLTDLVVGYEIAVRAGLSLHVIAADYHASGAWNAIGCAAIAARARRLSRVQTREALGIAEYYAPRAPMMRCIAHPSMVKDSSSWGAMTGISAADLAQDGFTGAIAAVCEEPSVRSVWQDLGERWQILETNFKCYPICRWSHPVVEALRVMVSEHRLERADISEIAISTFIEAVRLDTARPGSSDEAQYSLPLAAALAITFADVTPEHLHPNAFDRPDVWDLVANVRLSEKKAYSDAFPEERFADVTLTLQDGRTIRRGRAVARGTHKSPLSDKELLAKFDAYAAPALNPSSRSAVMAILTDPDRAPSPAELTALLGAAHSV